MRRARLPLTLLVAVAPAGPVLAETVVLAGSVERQPTNVVAIALFLAFVALTLVITVWAGRRTHSRSDYYVAGGHLTPLQNGAAIAGDFMSAASFLGFAAAIYLTGFDGLLPIVGVMASWPLMLCLIAEPLRNLGRYSLVDVVAHRLDSRRIRLLASCGALVVLVLNLIAQAVGAGKLVQLLFGLRYEWALLVISMLMVLYVSIGGMLATTWVQIIKAVLLLLGAVVLAGLALARFGFDPALLFERAVAVHPQGAAILGPTELTADPLAALSLGITMIFGTLALPHILMRFFTVPDAAAARKSVFISTTIIGAFYVTLLFIAYGAIALLPAGSSFHEAGGQLRGGTNMVALHLAHALGGSAFLGFMSAVAFATILAVVSGLTLSWSATLAHDVYAGIVGGGQGSARVEKLISRLSPIAFGAIAVVLGMAFERQNVAFVAILCLAVAASVNFPLLFLVIYWRGLTSRGALVGGTVGLVTSVLLIAAGPMVMRDILGFERPWFPYQQPTLFSMAAAFLAAWLFSITDRSEQATRERAAFSEHLIGEFSARQSSPR